MSDECICPSCSDEPEYVRVHIVSDGTLAGTTVCTEDGRILLDVVKIEWELEANKPALATIKLIVTEVDIVGEARRTPE